MKISIEWLEQKQTRAGKPYYTASVKPENGSLVNDVSIFDDFPDFANLKPGVVVFGEIKLNGKYKNLVTGTFSQTSVPKPGYNSRASGAVTAEKIRGENVEKAQARKNDSIAYFNSLNSAIAILGILGKSGLFDDMVGGRTQEAQALIVDWRDWFLSEYRKYEAQDITDKTRPF